MIGDVWIIFFCTYNIYNLYLNSSQLVTLQKRLGSRLWEQAGEAPLSGWFVQWTACKPSWARGSQLIQKSLKCPGIFERVRGRGGGLILPPLIEPLLGCSGISSPFWRASNLNRYQSIVYRRNPPTLEFLEPRLYQRAA